MTMVVAVVLRPPCGPTPGGTLHSETILRNKLTLLNLEKNVIYTIMTIMGTARRACHLVLNNIHKVSVLQHNCLITLDESACYPVHGVS